ncbi:MAG TPA: fumarylacetoacetate hydrolase family protein, partial [Terracidiphilus sp.]
MKLVAFSTADGRIRPGSLLDDGDLVIDLSAAGYADTLAVIAAGLTTPVSGNTYPAYPLSEVRLRAPLLNPPRVFAIGLNYRDHAKESGMAIPTTPVVFFKLPTAIIGPGEPIVLPINSSEPDYEAEFAFVIGRGGYRLAADEWRNHVYGYTIVNDVSARDVQFATSQWSMSKSFTTFCPLGPAIVTADEIADPHALAIGLTIDGEVLQSS